VISGSDMCDKHYACTSPSFALTRFNHNTYESAGVMSVVRGRSAAEKLLQASSGHKPGTIDAQAGDISSKRRI
jgi:hypothetical protein